MKKGLNIFMALGLLVTALVGCRNQKFKKESGNSYVMVYIGLDSIPRGAFFAKYSTRGVVDSLGKEVEDTSWSIRDVFDSVRNAQGKPVYDTVKKIWLKNEHWVDITETSNPPKNLIQIFPIPQSKNYKQHK